MGGSRRYSGWSGWLTAGWLADWDGQGCRVDRAHRALDGSSFPRNRRATTDERHQRSRPVSPSIHLSISPAPLFASPSPPPALWLLLSIYLSILSVARALVGS